MATPMSGFGPAANITGSSPLAASRSLPCRFPGLRGAIHPNVGLFRRAAEEIKSILVEEGVADMPIGVDLVEPPMLFELQRVGLDVRDGQQMMLDARELKSQDELMLLNTSAAMVDGTYQKIAEALKPGVRESQIVALANHDLYEKGSDCVEAINAISGERCSPHPDNFTDRLLRPGDQAFFDIIQSYMGYRTCYYRTFGVGRASVAQKDAYERARDWIDGVALICPGFAPTMWRNAGPRPRRSVSTARSMPSAWNSPMASDSACTSARS